MDAVSHARAGLGLRVETLAPRLILLTWRDEGPPTEAEEDLLLQVAASCAAGAVVVAVPGRVLRDSPLPMALCRLAAAPLTWSREGHITCNRDAQQLVPPHVRLPFVDRDGAHLQMLLFAPRGRGRVIVVRDAELERWREFLQPKCEAAAFRSFVEVLEEELHHADVGDVEDASSRGGDLGPLATARQLDCGVLRVAAPESAAFFGYSIERGGELIGLAALDARGRRIARLGRLVRGSESLRVDLTCGGQALLTDPTEQLVIVRWTTPEDRGALLRVELEHAGRGEQPAEDLGPWRLGDGAAKDRWSLDLFRIASDLLVGHKQAALAFTVERGEVVSSRYEFLLEREPAGIWLTELEPGSIRAITDRVGGIPATASRAVAVDRTTDGGLLEFEGKALLRGLELSGEVEINWAIPRGYRRFVAHVACTAPASSLFTVAVDGVAHHRVDLLKGAAPMAIDVELPGACQLSLQIEGSADARLILAEPALLR